MQRTRVEMASRKIQTYQNTRIEYYYHSLSLINMPTIPDCDLNCCHGSHFDAINMYYENIVAALHCASTP